MFHPVSDIMKCGIRASDGDIGRVVDLLFDDERWTIRYLVVDTGNWLPGRHVLISPFAIGQLIADDQVLTVGATRAQIERSPGVDTHRPISRRYEEAYARYYGYPFYWGGAAIWGASAYPAQGHVPTPPPDRSSPEALVDDEEPVLDALSDAAPEDVHLHSCGDVNGYHIDAIDGDIGHVDDFLVDDNTWAIGYLIVDTSNWWFGNRVLIAPDWFEGVDWTTSKAVVNLTRKAVREAPTYDPDRMPVPEDDSRLRSHYGRPSL